MNPEIIKLKEQLILEDFTLKTVILGIEIALDTAHKSGRVNIDSFLELLVHAEKTQKRRDAMRGELFEKLINAGQKQWTGEARV